ncbi:MAG: hypothetical protein HC896_18330 [Bacteroidales bacterium]|nr:hypothetical protein [Bacteroidales bacterium]
MKNLSNSISKYFETVPDFVRKWKLAVWLLLVAVTVVAILGLPRLNFDQTTDGWFREDDPVKIALDDFRAEFGSDDGIYILYKPKDGNLFSAQSLAAAKGVCDDIVNARAKIKEGEYSPLGHVVKVTSLANAKFLEAKDDMLTSRSLIGDTVPTSQQALDEMRRMAQEQKMFQLAYYSKDMEYGAIIIETNFGAIPVDFDESQSGQEGELTIDESMEITDFQADEKKVRFKPTDTKEYLALMKEVNALLDSAGYAEQLELHPVGNAAQSVYDAKIMEQMGMLYLGMLLVMIVILWFIFRSFAGVVWPIVVVILATNLDNLGSSGWRLASLPLFT